MKTIRCPIPTCGVENSADASQCRVCGTNLQAYVHLLMMADYYFNEGLTRLERGEFEQAEQFLQTSLMFNSNEVETMLLLAEAYALQDNLPRALSMLARVTEREVTPPLQALTAELQNLLVETPRPSAASAQKPNAHQNKKKKRRH